MASSSLFLEEDLREIWAQLCTGAEISSGLPGMTRGELVHALRDPELLALLVVCSTAGNTAQGERAVMDLVGDPEALVSTMLGDKHGPHGQIRSSYDAVTWSDFRRCLEGAAAAVEPSGDQPNRHCSRLEPLSPGPKAPLSPFMIPRHPFLP